MRPLVLSVWSSYSCGAQRTLTSRVHDVWSRDLRRTSVIMDLTRVPSVIVYLLLVMERWHVSAMSVKSIIIFSLFSTVVLSYAVFTVFTVFAVCSWMLLWYAGCMRPCTPLYIRLYDAVYDSEYTVLCCCISVYGL